MDALGRRVERLLYLSAPISFAAFVVLFIALALDSNKGRFSDICHKTVLAGFEANRAELDTLFPNKSPNPQHYNLSDYHVRVIGLLSDVRGSEKCRALTRGYSLPYSKLSPAEIGDDLRKKISDRKVEPFAYLGTELPEKATINVFGTKVLVELQIFVALLQIVLSPVLLVWLGSLMNTRAVEITRIAVMTDPTKVFPHVANHYAGSIALPSRKRGFLQRHLPSVFGRIGPRLYSVAESFQYFIPASIRAFFMGIVVIPPTFALLYSLYLVRIAGYDIFYFAAGVLVAAFGMVPMAMEFLPWIYRKSFEYESLRKFLGNQTR